MIGGESIKSLLVNTGCTQVDRNVKELRKHEGGLDAGNSIFKAKIARRVRGEVAFPHTLNRSPQSVFYCLSVCRKFYADIHTELIA